MEKNKEKELKYLPMEISILENMSQTVQKDMDSTIGKTDLTIEDSFCQEWGMAEASGRWSTEIHMKASIWMIKKMEKESIFGKMVLATKATSRMTIATAMVRCVGRMVEFTKENG